MFCYFALYALVQLPFRARKLNKSYSSCRLSKNSEAKNSNLKTFLDQKNWCTAKLINHSNNNPRRSKTDRKINSDSLPLQTEFTQLSICDSPSSSPELGRRLTRSQCRTRAMPPRRKRNEERDDDYKVLTKRTRTTNLSSRRNSKSSEKDTSDYVFSYKKCITWFHEYTGADEPDTLGPEGMEKFCEDIAVEPENIVMLVLAWKMDAKQMGFFTAEEWSRGLQDIQCDSPKKLQNRLEYLRTLLNDPLVFKSIYRYAYDFARDKDQRSMDIDTGKAMLQLLLGKHWPLYGMFHQYLEQSKYKVINKDQWFNILEFSRSIKPDLSNYDEDGAWPVLLDEFVEWLKAKPKE